MVAPHGLPILCVSRGMIHPFCVYEKEWSRRQLHQPLLPEPLEFVQHVRGHRAQNVRRKASCMQDQEASSDYGNENMSKGD